MAPKLYECKTCIVQKAAGSLGGALSPLVGPWQGPGEGSGSEVPKNIWLFDVQKT